MLALRQSIHKNPETGTAYVTRYLNEQMQLPYKAL